MMMTTLKMKMKNTGSHGSDKGVGDNKSAAGSRLHQEGEEGGGMMMMMLMMMIHWHRQEGQEKFHKKSSFSKGEDTHRGGKTVAFDKFPKTSRRTSRSLPGRLLWRLQERDLGGECSLCHFAYLGRVVLEVATLRSAVLEIETLRSAVLEEETLRSEST